MDLISIGKFIAENRKRKNLTQEQLANRLGITKNAVSKWERGLSFPDVSLYKELCKELDISIEELVNGERDNSDEAKEKTLIKTLNDQRKSESYIKIFVFIMMLLIILIGVLIYHNEKGKIHLINDADYLYDIAIDYLRKQDFETSEAKEDDYNSFYSYYGFGIEKIPNYYNVYMWVYQQSYYLEDTGALAIGKTSSYPCKVTLKDNEVIDIKYPDSGKNYESSLKKIFPVMMQNQILSFDTTNNMDKLFTDIQNKKDIYYNYLNIDTATLKEEDILYNDILFSVEHHTVDCINVLLTVRKNNTYTLYTEYAACRPNELCNAMLHYVNSIEGHYDYDVMQIIKHSVDANNKQIINNEFPEYTIITGKGYQFFTDSDNRYLNEFLGLIDVNLKECAKPRYK